MPTTFRASIQVDVSDPRALHAHAVQLATADGSLSAPASHQMLGTPDAPDLCMCILWILQAQSSAGMRVTATHCTGVN